MKPYACGDSEIYVPNVECGCPNFVMIPVLWEEDTDIETPGVYKQTAQASYNDILAELKKGNVVFLHQDSAFDNTTPYPNTRYIWLVTMLEDSNIEGTDIRYSLLVSTGYEDEGETMFQAGDPDEFFTRRV